MNAKKLLALSLACTLTLGLSACGGGQDAPSSSSPSGASDGDALKVGIILSTGGLGDKNFNDMTYAGAQQAEKDFGIEFDYVETQSASDFLPNYRMFAESGEYDLIIGLAADQTEAINEISIDFPEQKISHIDSSTDLPNVSAVYTKWQEQTFLTGVVAGLGTLSGMDKANSENVVGVILGQDQPTLRMGVVGFEAGVRYVNPDCEVLEAVVGDFNDWEEGAAPLARKGQGDRPVHVQPRRGLCPAHRRRLRHGRLHRRQGGRPLCLRRGRQPELHRARLHRGHRPARREHHCLQRDQGPGGGHLGARRAHQRHCRGLCGL